MTLEQTLLSRFLVALPLISLATLPACAAKVLQFESGGTNGSRQSAPDASGSSSDDAGWPVPDAGGGNDAGVTPLPGEDGGPSCWVGSGAQCGCQQTIAGSSYAYSCGAPYVTKGEDSGSVTTWANCICSVDGLPMAAFQSTCQNNVELQFTAPRTAPLDGCNFP